MSNVLAAAITPPPGISFPPNDDFDALLLAHEMTHDWFRAVPEQCTLTSGKVTRVDGLKASSTYLLTDVDHAPLLVAEGAGAWPALSFDGATTRFDVQNRPTITSSWGGAFIVKPTNFAAQGVLLGQHTSSFVTAFLALTTGGLAEFRQGTGTTTRAVSAAVYDSIIFGYDGETAFVEANGVRASAPSNGAVATASMVVGALDLLGGQHFLGKMTDMVLFNACPFLDPTLPVLVNAIAQRANGVILPD